MRPGGPRDDRLEDVLWSAPARDGARPAPPGGRPAPAPGDPPAPPPGDPPAPALATDTEADIAIVGGGFTGLTAALALRERLPDRHVVLLEATVCGAGASGRNAGMALPGCGLDLDGLERLLGAAGARHALAWMARGLARLETLAARHAPGAPIERTGSLSLARTARQARDQTALHEVYRRLGVDAEILDRDAVRREIASPLYTGGFHVPGGALLIDPHRLVRGLRGGVLASGVALHEHTPVVSLRDEERGTPGAPARVALVTPRATVRAAEVVLAVNAWSPHLGFFRNRVAPVHVACIATEPLAGSARAALGWRRRQALWEEGRVYHFLRLTPDDRVLIGGGGGTYVAFDGMTLSAAGAAYARLERALRRMFPQIAGARVTHRWSGPVAFARDFLPSIGTTGARRNIHYAAGYTGHGVALSHLAGETIAALAAGDRAAVAGEFLLDRRFPTLLCDPFKWIAVHAVRNGWLALDRLGF